MCRVACIRYEIHRSTDSGHPDCDRPSITCSCRLSIRGRPHKKQRGNHTQSTGIFNGSVASQTLQLDRDLRTIPASCSRTRHTAGASKGRRSLQCTAIRANSIRAQSSLSTPCELLVNREHSRCEVGIACQPWLGNLTQIWLCPWAPIGAPHHIDSGDESSDRLYLLTCWTSRLSWAFEKHVTSSTLRTNEATDALVLPQRCRFVVSTQMYWTVWLAGGGAACPLGARRTG